MDCTDLHEGNLTSHLPNPSVVLGTIHKTDGTKFYCRFAISRASKVPVAAAHFKRAATSHPWSGSSVSFMLRTNIRHWATWINTLINSRWESRHLLAQGMNFSQVVNILLSWVLRSQLALGACLCLQCAVFLKAMLGFIVVQYEINVVICFVNE